MRSSGPACGGPLISALAGEGRSSMPTRRESFVAARAPLPHREFCARLGVAPDLVAWIVCVRRAMGSLLGIPPSAIQPDDTWRELVPLHPCDWDDLGVVLALEELGVLFPSVRSEELPRLMPGRFFWMTWPAFDTFGEWAVAVSEHLVAHGCRLTRRSSGPAPRAADLGR
jgi:hypothetical protein